MPAEQDELKSKVSQAEAAVARAQKVYEEAQPGSTKDSYLQLLLAEKAFLLAEKKALEQWTEKDLLQLRAAAGVAHKQCPSLSLVCGLRVCCWYHSMSRRNWHIPVEQDKHSLVCFLRHTKLTCTKLSRLNLASQPCLWFEGVLMLDQHRALTKPPYISRCEGLLPTLVHTLPAFYVESMHLTLPEGHACWRQSLGAYPQAR